VNVPSGFKVALDRWRAINTGQTGGAGGAGGDSGGGGDIIVQEMNVSITAEDAAALMDEIQEELRKRKRELTGNPFGDEFNSGGG
jgi:hypothetical protein